MKTAAAALLAVGSVSALPALNSTAFAFTNGSLADAASNKTVTVTTPVTVTTVVEAMQTVYTTFAAAAPPSTQVVGDGAIAPAPTVTLTPAVHWDIVVGPEQLVPATAPSALYYDNGGAEANPNSAHQFGTASIQYTVPAVNLDHTGCVNSVSQSNDQLVVVFSNERCFSAAQASWPSGEEILIMTFSAICERHDSGDFCYFSSTSLSFSDGDLSVTLGGQITSPDDYIHAGTFSWGDYVPPIAEPTYYSGGSGDETPIAVATPTPTGGDADISGTYGPQVTKPACNVFDPKYGLQVGPIGQDFDDYLDECLGHYDDIDDTDFDNYVEDVTDNNELEPEDVVEATSEDLDDFLDYTYTEGYSQRVKRSSLGKRGKNFFEGLAPFTKFFTGMDPPRVDKRIDQSGAFNLPKVKEELVDSPWGPAMLIKKFEPKDKKSDKAKAAKAKAVKAKSPRALSSSFEPSLSLYCVGCGITGAMRVQGTVTIGDAKIIAGSIDADASIAAQVQIGIQAELEVKTEYEKDIGSVGLPGLSYGVLTIGPMITLGVEGEVSIKAEGTLLVGGKFNIPKARVHIDFADASKSTSSGWTPEFSKVFNTSGKIEASAGIGFPVGLACGLNIANGKYKATVGIVDKPGIVASAEVSFESSLAEGLSINTDNNTCKGVSAALNFNNTLYAEVNVFGAKGKYQIMKPIVKELAKTCIAFGKNATNTTSTAASSTPTSVSVRRRALLLDRRQSNQTVIDANLTFDDNEISDVTASAIKEDGVSSEGYAVEPLAFTDFNTTGKGADFIALVDNTENIIITSCSDKNIYIQPASYNASLSDVGCTVSWQNVEDSVVADGNGRVLHYYTNTMTTLNVSRLRISDEEDIPKQSEYVSLYAYGSDGALDKNTFDDPEDSDNFYYAVDRKDNVFYPVVCEYKNATAIPKIFLVADLDAGIALLESAELETIVTGAPVSKCSFMPMQQAFDNIDEDAEF